MLRCTLMQTAEPWSDARKAFRLCHTAVKRNLRKNALKRHYADLHLVAHVFLRPHLDTRLSHSAGCERQVS